MSLILWSLDEYYYYAVCIFIISVVSITTTLVETKSVGQPVHFWNHTDQKTMKRLRDISRFECEVRVLRNGFCRSSLSR